MSQGKPRHTGVRRFPPTMAQPVGAGAGPLNTVVLSLRVPQVLMDFLVRAGGLYGPEDHPGLSAGQLARLMIESAVEQLDCPNEQELQSRLWLFFGRLSSSPDRS